MLKFNKDSIVKNRTKILGTGLKSKLLMSVRSSINITISPRICDKDLIASWRSLKKKG